MITTTLLKPLYAPNIIVIVIVIVIVVDIIIYLFITYLFIFIFFISTTRPKVFHNKVNKRFPQVKEESQPRALLYFAAS